MVQPRLGCGKSELFYGWPDSSQPLAVLHTEGNEKGNVNVEEANAIIDILRDVYDRKKVKGTSVGVIARYKLGPRNTLCIPGRHSVIICVGCALSPKIGL